jgi:hypothetical protein
VKTTETIKLAPKVKQIVVGKLEMPKRREYPELECVEPAQLPQEGVLAARGLSRTFTKSPQSTRSQGAVNSVTSCEQLSGIQIGGYVHVMVVNFSDEEIQLPRATMLGVAEKTSASIVAEINDEVKTNSKYRRKTQCGVNSVADDANFEYLQDKLGHLSQAERSVMEPVLRKYRHVLHVEGSNDFKGTDLIEHRIITGDAKPIRKAPYQVLFALKKEMENQVQEMLKKGVTEESNSPWSAPAILVPKKSLDGRPKYRFCVDFRALNAVTQFDT